MKTVAPTHGLSASIATLSIHPSNRKDQNIILFQHNASKNSRLLSKSKMPLVLFGTPRQWLGHMGIDRWPRIAIVCLVQGKELDL
jgi:hypothetical protein